jgi:hypothetical protein
VWGKNAENPYGLHYYSQKKYRNVSDSDFAYVGDYVILHGKWFYCLKSFSKDHKLMIVNLIHMHLRSKTT